MNVVAWVANPGSDDNPAVGEGVEGVSAQVPVVGNPSDGDASKKDDEETEKEVLAEPSVGRSGQIENEKAGNRQHDQ